MSNGTRGVFVTMPKKPKKPEAKARQGGGSVDNDTDGLKLLDALIGAPFEGTLSPAEQAAVDALRAAGGTAGDGTPTDKAI